MGNIKWSILLIVTLFILFTVIISGAETRRRNTILPINKPDAGRKLINRNWLAPIYNILNSNTSIESLNNLVASFDTTVSSPGFTALDTFVNTIGNGFAMYDAIGNGIRRVLRFSQRLNEKKEAQQNEEEDIVHELKSSRDEMAIKLTSIESKFKCRLYKLVSTKRQRHPHIFPENCIDLSTMR